VNSSGQVASAVVVLLFLGFLVVGAGLFWAVGRVSARLRRAPQTPRRTAHATVVAKRREEPGERFSGQTGYYVTFAPDGEEPVELMLAGADHARLDVGATGRLTYEGTRFHAFVWDVAEGR
jgi:hypothetical protein